jgi:hypothetical protein
MSLANSMPYRSPARIEVKEKNAKPLYGLIRAPKPHCCGTPGFWARVWLSLTFRGVPKGSVYRCRECRKVWELYKPGHTFFLLDWLVPTYIEKDWDRKWEKMGGALESNLLPEDLENDDD